MTSLANGCLTQCLDPSPTNNAKGRTAEHGGAGQNLLPFCLGMKHREAMWSTPGHTAKNRAQAIRRLQRASIPTFLGLDDAACLLADSG